LGPELKFAGYDGIVLKGRAPTQPWVLIRDDVVELRLGDRYEGMLTSQVEESLRSDFDDEARILSIGRGRREPRHLGVYLDRSIITRPAVAVTVPSWAART